MYERVYESVIVTYIILMNEDNIIVFILHYPFFVPDTFVT